MSYANISGTTTGEQWNWYDGSGQRVFRRSYDGTNTTLVVYAFGLEEHDYLVTGTTATSTNDVYYYTLAGRLIGELSGSSTALHTTFLLTDTLGSVVSSINNVSGSASVQGNQAYSPYGTKRYSKGSVGTDKGFTGQTSDPTTGLDDYGARYYDPVVGRFVTADGVQGDLQGMDPYAYVGGNPETLNDPTGQLAIEQGSEGAVQMIEAPPPDASGSVAPSDGTGDGGGGGGIGGIPLIGFAIAWVYSLVSGNASTSPPPAAVSSGPDIRYGPVLNSVAWYAYRHQHPQSPAGGTTSSGGGTSPSGGGTSPLGASGSGGATASTTTWNWPTTSPLTQTGGGGMRPPGSSQTVAAPGDFCSFTPDTQVSTAQGKQDIGSLHVGDKVWAYNPKTKQMELQPVEHVWMHQDQDLVDLTIKSVASASVSPSKKGEAGHTAETLHTTSEHPFLTSEQGFVAAGSLKVGMHVRQADGSIGIITGWHLVSGSKQMYNLEVAQDHTFVVGAGQWIVHNRCGPQDYKDLRSNMEQVGIEFQQGQQAHHVIPCALEGHPLIQATDGIFDKNAAYNGRPMWGKAYQAEALNDAQPYHYYHTRYNMRVKGMMNSEFERLASSGTLTPDNAFNSLLNLINVLNAGIDQQGLNSALAGQSCLLE